MQTKIPPAMSGIAVERMSIERVVAREIVYQYAPKTCPVMKEVVGLGDSSNIIVAKMQNRDIKISCLYKPKDTKCAGCSLVHKNIIHQMNGASPKV